MRVKVFTPDYNAGNRAVLEDFAAAVPGAQVHDDREYKPCDVMVIFGLVKRSFRKSWAKADLLKAHGKKPVVVIERGFVDRGNYWSVGLNGINGMADFNNDNSPRDRWRRLGVTLRPWDLKRDKPVLVCGQVPWDVTVQDSDHVDWCRATVRKIKRMGRDVIFRAHPAARKKGVDYGVSAPVSTMPSLAGDLARCSAVVTWSSNAAVEAVIAGVPAIAVNQMSMAWPVVGHCLTSLHAPAMPHRGQWAADLAYAQWRRSEFGDAWRHIAGAL